MPCCDGKKESKNTRIINKESTGLRRSARWDNKPRQKYGLFYKFSLEVIVACDVAKNYNIFLTRGNQHIQ